jgi:ribosome recycling factor
MINEVLKEAEERMQKAVEALKDDLQTVRTGRASPALVERLPVDYYGVPTPLVQLATISAPEPRLLTIRPWDEKIVPIIERAILKSDLGLTPSSDGKIIRLAIPRLTEERRKELVRLVVRRVEEGRVAVRNIRREAVDDLRELEKEGLISEDEMYRGRDEIQKLTDRYIAIVDDVGLKKEAEIMEV